MHNIIMDRENMDREKGIPIEHMEVLDSNPLLVVVVVLCVFIVESSADIMCPVSSWLALQLHAKRFDVDLLWLGLFWVEMLKTKRASGVDLGMVMVC